MCERKTPRGSQSSPHQSCSMWQAQIFLCHLVVGACLTVICYDYRGALTYMSFLSVTSPMSLSHTQYSFQIPQRNHSVKRRRKKIGERKGSVSQHWSEPLQEFKLQPLMIAGSTSWAPFCFRISSKEYTSWNILPLQLKQLRISSISLWVDDDK